MHSFRSLSVCLCLLIAATLQSCTAWTVVEQANPNPFVGQKAFSYRPLEFSSTPEVEAGKEANRDRDMESMKPIFADTLKQTGRDAGFTITESGAPYTIRTNVTELELGSFWTGYSQVNVTVELLDQAGKKLDVFTVDHRVNVQQADGNQTTQTHGNVSVTTGGPSSVGEMVDSIKSLNSGNRIRTGAAELAKIVIDYLTERTAGQ